MEGKELKNEASNKKLTYEELENLLLARNVQLEELYNQLQQANANNVVVHLDFLFRAIENKDMFDSTFIKNCVEEITNSLTPIIPEQVNSAE